jgi:hypothetical protein
MEWWSDGGMGIDFSRTLQHSNTPFLAGVCSFFIGILVPTKLPDLL